MTVDKVRLYIRSDFPHDTYWTNLTIQFSDGSTQDVTLQKTSDPQDVTFRPRKSVGSSSATSSSRRCRSASPPSPSWKFMAGMSHHPSPDCLMRPFRFFRSGLAVTAACLLIPGFSGAQAETVTREQIITEGESMANAQLAVFSKHSSKGLINWIDAIFWAGLADFSHVSSKPDYAAALTKLGTDVNWTPYDSPKRPFQADNLCITQVFLDVYVTKKDPAILAPSQDRLNAVADHLLQEKALTWWWCATP